MENSNNVIEIIPDDLPDWAEDLIQSGQLFNQLLKLNRLIDKWEASYFTKQYAKQLKEVLSGKL